MSRTLPTDCPHGVTVDWGDFGPCQDCSDHGDDDCPNLTDCPDCATGRQRLTIEQHLERLELLYAEYRRQGAQLSKNARRRLFAKASGVRKAIDMIKQGES